MADSKNTLLLPFEQGILTPPAPGENWVFLNSEVLPDSESISLELLTCEQGLRPKFNQLQRAGYDVQPLLESAETVDGCLILADRVRAVNEYNLTRGWNRLKAGGLLVYCGDKKMGVQSVRKWLSSKIKLESSQSKHHAIVFWARKTGDNWQLPDLEVKVDGFQRSAGMFSADGPDVGSVLLAQQINERIAGRVADFGAGWGYLAKQIVQKSPHINALELFEADWASLEAAKKNVGEKALYHWCDLAAEPPRGPFDWVIMNPPFHQGRAAEPELGIKFIQAAARVLPSGGRLLMVANVNLPYEKTLDALFRRVERLDQANGFKVIQAVKGGR